MTRRFRLHPVSRDANEIRDLPISTDFCTQKHRVVTPVYPANIRLDEEVFKTSWSRPICSP